MSHKGNLFILLENNISIKNGIIYRNVLSDTTIKNDSSQKVLDENDYYYIDTIYMYTRSSQEFIYLWIQILYNIQREFYKYVGCTIPYYTNGEDVMKMDFNRYCKNNDDPRNAVQNVFIKMYKNYKNNEDVRDAVKNILKKMYIKKDETSDKYSEDTFLSISSAVASVEKSNVCRPQCECLKYEYICICNGDNDARKCNCFFKGIYNDTFIHHSNAEFMKQSVFIGLETKSTFVMQKIKEYFLEQCKIITRRQCIYIEKMLPRIMLAALFLRRIHISIDKKKHEGHFLQDVYLYITKEMAVEMTNNERMSLQDFYRIIRQKYTVGIAERNKYVDILQAGDGSIKIHAGDVSKLEKTTTIPIYISAYDLIGSVNDGCWGVYEKNFPNVIINFYRDTIFKKCVIEDLQDYWNNIEKN